MNQVVESSWPPPCPVMRERGEVVALRRELVDRLRPLARKDFVLGIRVACVIANTLSWVLGECTTDEYWESVAGVKE